MARGRWRKWSTNKRLIVQKRLIDKINNTFACPLFSLSLSLFFLFILFWSMDNISPNPKSPLWTLLPVRRLYSSVYLLFPFKTCLSYTFSFFLVGRGGCLPDACPGISSIVVLLMLILGFEYIIYQIFKDICITN